MLHTLKGIASTRQVWLDGQLLDPAPSQEVRNHSPDGFNWGYEGSGPVQLALAINIALPQPSHIHYQELKRQIIARIPTSCDFEAEFILPVTSDDLYVFRLTHLLPDDGR